MFWNFRNCFELTETNLTNRNFDRHNNFGDRNPCSGAVQSAPLLYRWLRNWGGGRESDNHMSTTTREDQPAKICSLLWCQHLMLSAACKIMFLFVLTLFLVPIFMGHPELTHWRAKISVCQPCVYVIEVVIEGARLISSLETTVQRGTAFKW